MISLEITSYEKSRKNTDRLMVYVDNDFSFSISEEDFLRLNLYEKKEITQDEINYIKNDVECKRAKSDALRYLTLKVRSEYEVRNKLDSEGYIQDIIEAAVGELKSIGYINDTIYAQKYLFDRSKLKPKSKRMLKVELLNKGIKETLIDEALQDFQVNDEAIAESLARKKFGKYDIKDEKVIRKIHAFLNHRGFSYEIINGVINLMKNEK